MSWLRRHLRLACWAIAALAGGPWLWIGSFVMERHAHEVPLHLLERARIYANFWLMLGGVTWYFAWSFGTLLLPRQVARSRHDRTLHRRLDAVIVLLVPVIVILFWAVGDPDPRNFRRMMPSDGIFIAAALFALLQAVCCCQVFCLEGWTRQRAPARATPVKAPEGENRIFGS